MSQSLFNPSPSTWADTAGEHRSPDWVPSCKPWEMSEVLVELLKQALHLLKPGGRLVRFDRSFCCNSS